MDQILNRFRILFIGTFAPLIGVGQVCSVNNVMEGTSFTIPMPIRTSGQHSSIYVSSPTENNCIELLLGDTLELFTGGITADSVWIYNIPDSLQTESIWTGINDTFLTLHARFPVVVYLHHQFSTYNSTTPLWCMSEVIPVIPDHTQPPIALEIDVPGYSGRSNSGTNGPSHFFLATTPDTFSITPTVPYLATPPWPDGVTSQFFLDRGQELRVHDSSFVPSFSNPNSPFTGAGTLFYSDGNARLFNAYLQATTPYFARSYKFPDCYNAGNPLDLRVRADWSYLPAVDYGALKNYYLLRSFQINDLNLVRILSMTDSNQVYLDGVPFCLLDATEYLDTCYAGVGILTSDYPIAIAQVGSAHGLPNPGTNYVDEPGEFAITGVDTTQLITKAIFATRSFVSADEFGLQMYARTKDTASILVDGVTPVTGWVPFGYNPAWSWIDFAISSGTHVVESEAGFIALHYGFVRDSITTPTANAKLECYGSLLSGSTDIHPDSLAFHVISPAGREPFASFNEKLCPGDSLGFQVNVARFTSWVWTVNGIFETWQGASSNRLPPVYITFDQPGTYWVKVVDSVNGCQEGDSVLVEVLPSPTADFTYSFTQNCEGTNLVVQATGTGDNQTWLLPDGQQVSGASLVLEANSLAYPVTLGLVEEAGGCRDTSYQTIDEPGIVDFDPEDIPNVFTPNGDGLNDLWKVPGGEYLAGCYKVVIFNRWGAVVFESDNPQTEFTGNSPSGNPLPDGVYYYVLEVHGVKYTGNISIFR